MLQVTGYEGTKNLENVLFCPSIPSHLQHNLNFQRQEFNNRVMQDLTIESHCVLASAFMTL